MNSEIKGEDIFSTPQKTGPQKVGSVADSQLLDVIKCHESEMVNNQITH